MNKYIDAEKLIGKIEKLKNELKSLMIKLFYAANYKEWEAELNGYNKILSIVSSLQQDQPEVDLEKYIENEINHYGLSLYEASYGTFSASQIDRIIRNAFELGLNARKEQPAQVADASKMERLNVDDLHEWSMRYAPGFREMIEATAYHFWNLAICSMKEE